MMSDEQRRAGRLAGRAALAGAALALTAGAATAQSGSQASEGIRPDATMLQYPDVSTTHIVFTYANDLWLVPRSGGEARKLASPPGREVFPKFSPDGQTIAFMGNYEGDLDLYTIPAHGAGAAYRVTHHPATERLTGWTPDGESLIFFASGFTGLTRTTAILTVDADGGLPETLPVPYGANGAISQDGKWLAYTPNQRDNRTWKRYRGGMASDIWLFNLETYESRRITDWEGTDSLPMWHDNKVYYLSDAGPEHRLNIWMFNPRNGDREQVTEFAEFDVKWPSMGPGVNGRGEIVFQNGPDVHRLDLRSEESVVVDIVIPGDRPTLRRQKIDYSDFASGGDVSPEGKRVTVEARGDIWSLPAEDGVSRNLTRTSGVAERSPVWSPDGRWIAYLSDETGEYEVYITQSDGKGETRQLTSNGEHWRYLRSWSPDSETILFTDKTGAIYLLDVETGDQTLVAVDPWAEQQPVSWSHDSNWLAFALTNDENQMGVVHLYDIENGELHAVTSSMFDSTNPVFDRAGEFLYFASARNFSPTYSDIDTTFVYDDAEVLIAVPLNGDVEDPWAIEVDDVTWEEEEDEDADEENGEGENEGDAENGENGENGEGDASDHEASDDENDPFAGYDLEHPLWGVWSGTVRGLEQMNAMSPGMFSDDEMPYRLVIIVDDEGELFVQSEFMGETNSPDSASFDPDTNTYEATSAQGPSVSTSTATLSGDTLSGEWSIEIEAMGMSFSGAWTAQRTDEEIDEELLEEVVGEAGGSGDSDEPLVVDLEDFESRARRLSVSPGSFGSLAVNDKNQLLYIRSGDGLPGVKLYDIDKDEDGEKAVLSPAFGFTLTPEGKKLAAIGPPGWTIVSAAAGQSWGDTVDTSDMEGFIKPREEWKQLVRDAWRVQRDFFYDPGLHGVDWEAVGERYIAMVDDAVTREDVSFIIREMISELNVGHAYYFGGDTEDAPSENVGMLGADYALVTDEDGNTAYQFATIYEGAPWDVDARNPLRAPSVDVEEGDFLLAVNGVELTPDLDPWALFQGRAGEITELTVSDKPVMGDDARTVHVEPLGSENNLRFRHWIEKNREYVDYQSGGKIGYIYVVNTGVPGQNDLFRQFYGQRHKDALIIDERWNGGGQIPTRFIELLNRPRTNYWARRDGNDWPWPPDSHQGPKAMLINGLAGSGGDMFPALFRQMGLGKLIGTRTWGGLVGISGNPALIDGGYTSAPTFGYYETDGTWGIEGHGVDPDIRVVDDPAKMIAGPDEVADPQLDAAIEHLLVEIQRNPYEPPQRPAGPDRSGMGIAEEDK